MYILNVKVYSENDAIKINFDSIMIGRGDQSVPDITIHTEMIESFYYSYPEIVEAVLRRRTSLCPKKIRVNYRGELRDCFHSTSVYELPTNKNLALDFLFAFNTVLKKVAYDYIVFNDFSVDEHLLCISRGNSTAQNELYVSIESLLGLSELVFTIQNLSSAINFIRTAPKKIADWFLLSIDSVLTTPRFNIKTPLQADLAVVEIIKRIQKINTLKQYQDMHGALSQVNKWCQSNNDGLCVALEPEKRFIILMNLSTDFPLSLDLEQKLLFLFRMQRKFLYQGKVDDLIHFVDNMNLTTKKKLFQRCIGARAADREKYHWGYAEWFFLCYAKFHLLPDGGLYINVSENRG